MVSTCPKVFMCRMLGVDWQIHTVFSLDLSIQREQGSYPKTFGQVLTNCGRFFLWVKMPSLRKLSNVLQNRFFRSYVLNIRDASRLEACNEELGFIIPHDTDKTVKFTDTFDKHRTRFLQQWEKTLTEEEMKCCKNRIFKNNNSPLFQSESAWRRNFKM